MKGASRSHQNGGEWTAFLGSEMPRYRRSCFSAHGSQCHHLLHFSSVDKQVFVLRNTSPQGILVNSTRESSLPFSKSNENRIEAAG